MWNSASTLSAIAFWSLIATAVFGGLAVVTGLIGGVTANRASEIKGAEDAKEIAEANARAEEAKLRTEELKKQLAWRDVNPDQLQKLKENLAGQDFLVTIMWITGDPEGTYFAGKLRSALEECGLAIIAFAPCVLWEDAPGSSMKVTGPEFDELIAIHNAFSEADIGIPDFHRVEAPQTDPEQPNSIINIFIGYRDAPGVEA